MTSRKLPFLLFTSICLLSVGFIAACPASDEGDDDDDDDDSGEGEGEGEEGEGEEGEGEEGEGEGEGEGEFQGEEYFGTLEEGVICDAQTCDLGVACCVAFDIETFTIVAACGTTGATCPNGETAGSATLPCDGAEDCLAGEECCIAAGSEIGPFTTRCTAAGTCEVAGSTDSLVCVNTIDDCSEGNICCGFGAALDAPVDLGVCAPAEDECAAAAPGG